MLVPATHPLILINRRGLVLTWNKAAKKLIKNISTNNSIIKLYQFNTPEQQKLTAFFNDKSLDSISLKTKNQIVLYQKQDIFSDGTVLLKISLFPTEVDLPFEPFIQFVSHEFKSPLTTIKLFADLLSVNISKLNISDPKIFHHLSKIDSKIDFAVSQINDYADLVRLDQNILKMNYSSQPLKLLINQAVKEIENPQTTVKIDKLPPINVFVDASRFIQALINFVNYISQKSSSNTFKISCNTLPESISLLIYSGNTKILNHKKFISRPSLRPGISLILSQKLMDSFAARVEYLEFNHSQFIVKITLPTSN